MQAIDDWTRLTEAARRHRRAEIDDATYAALYFMYGQIAAHGARFAARRYRADPRPDPARWLAELAGAAGADLRARLLHYLSRYHFLSVIPNVPVALCAWLRGEWALSLCDSIPAPVEVLRMQAQGRRPVTLIAAYPRLMRPVLNKPNALAFMIHDLAHAYKFFHDPLLHAGQKAFFVRLEKSLARGDFTRHLSDPVFAAKFDYLMSDMNTHVQHSLHYLRAVLIESVLRRAGKPPRDRLSRGDAAEIAVLLDVLGEKGGGESVAGPGAERAPAGLAM